MIRNLGVLDDIGFLCADRQLAVMTYEAMEVIGALLNVTWKPSKKVLPTCGPFQFSGLQMRTRNA